MPESPLADLSFLRALAAAREESRLFTFLVMQPTWRRNRRTYYVHHEQSLENAFTHASPTIWSGAALEHKERRPGSFTARYNIDRLVYFEEFDEINQAILRESEIKQMARRTKIALIESMNPEWRDLTAE